MLLDGCKAEHRSLHPFRPLRKHPTDMPAYRPFFFCIMPGFFMPFRRGRRSNRRNQGLGLPSG